MTENQKLHSDNYDDPVELRWRLMLGDEDKQEPPLNEEMGVMDETLEALYNGGDGVGLLVSEVGGGPKAFSSGKPGQEIGDSYCEGEEDGSDRKGGLGDSVPKVAKWLNDARKYFPDSVVQILQKDAIEIFDLPLLFLEPEMLDVVEADVNTLATILSLKELIPEKSKSNARVMVEKIVEQLLARLSDPFEQTIQGTINRAIRTKNPRNHKDINFIATIKANLHNYVKELNTVIPEVLIGYGRQTGQHKKAIHLLIDQSGSMATSVVYAGIFSSVLSSIGTIDTRVIGFDTSVIDLTDQISDPVDLLFGIQIGGGTDINNAVAYSEKLISSPAETTMVIITDLFEGGNTKELLARIQTLSSDGVNIIILLALNDEGAPCYDHKIAQKIRSMDIPVFACTPDHFPEVMANALERKEIPLFQ